MALIKAVGRRLRWLALVVAICLLATVGSAQGPIPLRGPPLAKRPPNPTPTFVFTDPFTGDSISIVFSVREKVALMPRKPDVRHLDNGTLFLSGEFAWTFPPQMGGGQAGGGIGGGGIGGGGIGGFGGGGIGGGGIGGFSGGFGGGFGGTGGGFGGGGFGGTGGFGGGGF